MKKRCRSDDRENVCEEKECAVMKKFNIKCLSTKKLRENESAREKERKYPVQKERERERKRELV